MINYSPPLEPDKYYHIYNHANGRENLFQKERNYLFFLKKYTQYINPIADTFAYCLMPNHFHFAIRIKEQSTFQKFQTFGKLETISKYISKQFSNLFSSYTQSFNKEQKRKGSLFVPNFSRKEITTNHYFKQLIHYTHYNPVHHGFVKELREWKYTSYEAFFSKKATNLKREEVIQWFDNKENFYKFHQKEIDEKIALELEF